MKTIKEFLCTICPMGCALKVETEDEKVLSISGNSCNRGLAYAQTEAVHPTRMLTTTIRVIGGSEPLVPVRTEKPIPKEKQMEYMAFLNRQRVQAPVVRDQEICVLPDCDVKIIATAGVLAAQ